MKLWLLLLAVLLISVVADAKRGRKGENGKKRHGHEGHGHGHTDHNHGDCKKDFLKLKTCTSGIFKAAGMERDTRREMKAQEKDDCFTSNGCSSPDFGTRMAGWKAEKKAKCDCVKGVFESDMKDGMQTCIRRIVPDFSFPPNFWEMMKNKKKLKGRKGKGGHGHGGPGKYKKLFKMCDTMNEVMAGCPDDEARAKVKKCLLKVPFKVRKRMEEDHEEGHDSHEEEEHGSHERKEQFRDCFESMSMDCQYKMADIKENLCKCAVEQLEDGGLTKKIHDCYDADEDDDDAEDEDDDNFHLQWVEKKMVKFFCKRGGKGGHGSHKGSDSSHDSHKKHSDDDDDD